MFGHIGPKSKELLWADIRKRLRENKREQNISLKGMFIKKAINPEATLVHHWTSFMVVLGIYYFILVPIRICFVPWGSMLDYRALCTDLVADACNICNLVLLANTAYKNSRAVWITDRYKLFKKVHVGYWVSAIPLDW